MTTKGYVNLLAQYRPNPDYSIDNRKNVRLVDTNGDPVVLENAVQLEATFKTINGQSIIGSGDIKVEGGSISDSELNKIKEELNENISKKQDVIEDLDVIRSGAESGATALQDAPQDDKQYTRLNGEWVEVEKSAEIDAYTKTQSDEKYAGKTIETDVEDLLAEVFPVKVAYVSSNAGTYETGDTVRPQVSLSVTRRGEDITDRVTISKPGVATSTNTGWVYNNPIVGAVSYDTEVTYNGQTIKAGNKSWNFSFYRYRGELTAEPSPSDYATAIKSLATKELSTVTTLGSTALAANKYYLFAVRYSSVIPRLICKHALTGGVITGCIVGVCKVDRVNGTGTDNYAYILVPKSSSSWNFTITNS